MLDSCNRDTWKNKYLCGWNAATRLCLHQTGIKKCSWCSDQQLDVSFYVQGLGTSPSASLHLENLCRDTIGHFFTVFTTSLQEVEPADLFDLINMWGQSSSKGPLQGSTFNTGVLSACFPPTNCNGCPVYAFL